MVQVLDEVPSFGSALGRGLGQGVGAALPKVVSRELENAALRKYGANLAGIEDPSLRQSLAQMGIQRQMRSRSDLAKLGLEAPSAPISMKESLTEAMPSRAKMMPSKERPAVRETVTETIRPEELKMRTPDELKQEAALRYQATLEAGGMPDLDAINQQLALEESRKDAMRLKQEEYGKIYEEALKNVFEEASPETKAAIRQRGQNAIFQGKDEATIKREATQYANQIANAKAAVEKILRRNIFQDVKARMAGSAREQENIKSSAAAAVKKLTDLGLVNEARSYLSDSGWYPEEREEIMSKALGSGFSEDVMAAVNSFVAPKKKFKDSFDPKKPIDKLDPAAYPDFKESFDRAIEADPNVNLILLRKKYEDKGVDWESFKRALDDAVLTGKIDPASKGYMAQQAVLDEPPLGFLGKVLYKFKLRGR